MKIVKQHKNRSVHSEAFGTIAEARHWLRLMQATVPTEVLWIELNT